MIFYGQRFLLYSRVDWRDDDIGHVLIDTYSLRGTYNYAIQIAGSYIDN